MNGSSRSLHKRERTASRAWKLLWWLVCLSALLLLLTGAAEAAAATSGSALELPWREAGLTERQAAAHLLDRLAYGPRPGEIDRVLETGLATWVESQLDGSFSDAAVDGSLERLDLLDLPIAELNRTVPRVQTFILEAQEAGVLPADFAPGASTEAERRELMSAMMAFARERGYRRERELLGQLMAQKILRAALSENQLQELLTDFWFNHFNVSLTDNQSRRYVPSYERDAIRPYVLGSFPEMLAATARHPAMLLYLDNAQSIAEESATTTLELAQRGRGGFGRRGGRGGFGGEMRRRSQNPNRPSGLNENYARELLELHTLGVDGGYDQQDVIEVARAFTGWSIYPAEAGRPDVARRLQFAMSSGFGFVAEDGFLFRADAHDAETKTVLGNRLPGGRGIEDGEEVLRLLADHPSTARHLALKLATRFVADEPPPSLVDSLAAVYRATDGSIRAMLEAVVESPEFWSADSRQHKIKSPFELAVSAVRAVDAKLYDPRGLVEWIERMGQPLYAYQAPTGYPDRAEFWVNTGALLNRMNFGLALAAGEVPGVRVDLDALLDGREPESREQALEQLLPVLLPERGTTSTVDLLRQLASTPDLAERVEAAAPDAAPAALAPEEAALFGAEASTQTPRRLDPAALDQVAGVILGSPEFQRR